MGQSNSYLPFCVFELDILPCTIVTSRLGDAQRFGELELEARVSSGIFVSCNVLDSTAAPGSLPGVDWRRVLLCISRDAPSSGFRTCVCSNHGFVGSESGKCLHLLPV